MNRPTLALVALATLFAAACQDQAPAGEPTASEGIAVEAGDESPTPMTLPVRPEETVPPPTTSIETEAGDSQCGADKLGRWLNVLPTEPIKAEIAATVGERPIRYYTQGDPITMDFSAARLNVELGEDGRIKLFRCG